MRSAAAMATTTCTRNGGNDWLEGDAGNDVLTGGDGSDRIEGGGGIDTANYADVVSAAGVTVSLDNFAGTARTFDALGTPATDTLSGIENVIGSNFGDRLYGGAGMNFIKGGYGDDVIAGGGGNDTLAGGAGRDVFYFRYGEAGGADTILDWDATNDLVELGTLGAPVVRNAGGTKRWEERRVLDSDHNGLVNDADVRAVATPKGLLVSVDPTTTLTFSGVSSVSADRLHFSSFF